MWKPYISINPIYFKTSSPKKFNIKIGFDIFLNNDMFYITILCITFGLAKYSTMGIYYRGQKLIFLKMLGNEAKGTITGK